MSIGSELRAARERLGLTPTAVAVATRGKTHIIEAIEEDDFSSFAAPIYAKGFIRLYAQYVGLDPQPLLDAYAGQIDAAAKRPSLITEEKPPARAADTAPAAAAPRGATEDADRLAPPDAPEPAPRSAGRAQVDDYDLFNAAEERQPPPPDPGEDAPARAARPRHIVGERLGAAGELAREVWIRWTQSLVEAVRPGTARVAGLNRERDPWTLLPVTIGIILILVFAVSGLTRCARSAQEAHTVPVRVPGEPLQLAVEPPAPYFD